MVTRQDDGGWVCHAERERGRSLAKHLCCAWVGVRQERSFASGRSVHPQETATLADLHR